MTQFSPQSTDRTRDNTNPLVSNVVYESSASITLSLSGSWYSGSVTVALPLDTQYAGLEVEAWVRVQSVGGGNIVSYFKIPMSATNASGTLTRSGTISITQPAKTSEYDITFTYGSTSNSLVNPVVYYRIKTDRIAAGGLTFT